MRTFALRRLISLRAALIVAAMVIGSALLPTGKAAGPIQLPNGWLRVFISRRPVVPVAQATPVWCWAASLSALFAYYGHPVSQQTIAYRYFPPGVVTPGPPIVLMNALNTTWTDDNGQKFQVQSAITNRFPVPPTGMTGPFQVSNQDILNALQAEKPVFYADLTHAMVLVQADYVYSPFAVGPQVMAGGAIDPEACMVPCAPFGQLCPVATGFRPLLPVELTGMFAAIPTSFKNVP